MPLILSQDDVALLLQGKASPEARAAVAGKVATTLASQELTTEELALAQDIIRTMVRDVSLDVRRALSEELKNTPQLPREAALALAADTDEVALPILQYSTVLTDTDLLQVIEKAGEAGTARHEAIAARSSVSSLVADALIEQAGETAVAKLVGNPGAVLRERSLSRVLVRFPYSEPVQQGLVSRPQLPLLIAEQLVELVADDLRQQLAARHELKPETLATIILDGQERASLAISSRAGRDVEVLAAQMYANGRLTTTLLLRALCTGDIAFFEAALAELAHVPIVNARLLIHDGGRLGLKSICERAKVEPRYIAAYRAALDVLHDTAMEVAGAGEPQARFRNTVIERIVTQQTELADDDISYLVAKIQSLGVHAA